ncbi:MAG: hypothetical protein JXM71_00835 [Spirochaetales bacterium]|nr:hypothetical protein [Spirochaetales bacterium]
MAARDLLAADGLRETGASNLVSAIYLAYRAYDTVGETVVLLAALAGAVAITSAVGGGIAEHSAGNSRPARTEILDVVAGKLAPVVLLFGTYVMLYGHESPGGGFQGGVVVASGIVFIAMGRRSGGRGRMEPSLRFFGTNALARVEALAFSSILLLSFPGISGALALPPVWSIVALNMAIGLKVGAGVALMSVMMLGGSDT